MEEFIEGKRESEFVILEMSNFLEIEPQGESNCVLESWSGHLWSMYIATQCYFFVEL